MSSALFTIPLALHSLFSCYCYLSSPRISHVASPSKPTFGWGHTLSFIMQWLSKKKAMKNDLTPMVHFNIIILLAFFSLTLRAVKDCVSASYTIKMT